MSLPSPLNSDPLLDSYSNFGFYNEAQLNCFDEFISDFPEQSLKESYNCNTDSTLSSNSIIDFDLFQDQDINLDIFFNQELEEHDDINQNMKDSNLEDDNYFFAQPVFKSPRKTKQKSILPVSIRDIDQDSYGKSNCVKINLKNQDLINGKPGDRIYLSKEEKELLIRDGCNLPTHLPLTKSEERALKNVRRKIRNKISAKVSRAKKETYVEGLEQRLLQCSKENSMLRMKLAETEKDKITLFQQVVNLQKQLSKYMPHASTRSTSLMLLLTFIFILSPIIDPRQILTRFTSKSQDESTKFILPGRTRILLQESETSTEVLKPYLVTVRQTPPGKINSKTIGTLMEMKALENNNQSNNISIIVLNKQLKIEAIKDL